MTIRSALRSLGAVVTWSTLWQLRQASHEPSPRRCREIDLAAARPELARERERHHARAIEGDARLISALGLRLVEIVRRLLDRDRARERPLLAFPGAREDEIR